MPIIQTVPPLYRSLECPLAVNNHLQGILWLRLLKYFRELEGPGRDTMEGIGSFTVGRIVHVDVADERPIFPGFILCFSELPLPKFGEFILELTQPEKLRERIAHRFPQGTSIEWSRVEYDKRPNLESVPTPSQGWDRKHFTKPEEFADEREWRLVVFLPPPLRLLNDTIKPHVGNLQGLFGLKKHDPPRQCHRRLLLDHR